MGIAGLRSSQEMELCAGAAAPVRFYAVMHKALQQAQGRVVADLGGLPPVWQPEVVHLHVRQLSAAFHTYSSQSVLFWHVA